MAGRVSGSWGIVAHGPEGESWDVEEGDESVGFGTPGCEEAGEGGVGGWEDGFVGVGPGGVLEVHGYDVEGLAVGDGVAEDGFAWERVVGIVGLHA